MLYFFLFLLTFFSLTSAAAPLGKLVWCRPLHWQSPPKEHVALVAFPGSGSTWLRYLLQQVTGIHTGSLYTDVELLNNGFPGESVSNGSVLLVKTEEGYFAEFTSAVMLIRLPQDAILADFNRLVRSHFDVAPRTAFFTNMSKDIFWDGRFHKWKDFVREDLLLWESLYRKWLKDFPGPIYVVFYEDLVRDTRRWLTGVLEFFKVKYSELDMACALNRKEGIFHRRSSQRIKNFYPFTAEMFHKINPARKKVFDLAKKYIKHTSRSSTPKTKRVKTKRV